MVVNVHILYLFSRCVSFALLIIDFIVILHVGPTFDTCSIKDQSISHVRLSYLLMTFSCPFSAALL